MRLIIAAIGKLKRGSERELSSHYLGRAEALGRNLSLSPLTAVELPESKAGSARARRTAEAEALLAKVPPTFYRICLDPAGEALSSEGFARMLAELRDRGTAGLAFLIGGPDGLGNAVQDEAQFPLSLGPMTLPHGLARIVLAEQLYRAMTILAGHPYHRG
jgi:23S rRNA (pseudouridine1915-N3)-methyltransferase